MIYVTISQEKLGTKPSLPRPSRSSVRGIPGEIIEMSPIVLFRWEEAGVSILLSTNLARDQALALAETLQPSPDAIPREAGRPGRRASVRSRPSVRAPFSAGGLGARLGRRRCAPPPPQVEAEDPGDHDPSERRKCLPDPIGGGSPLGQRDLPLPGDDYYEGR